MVDIGYETRMVSNGTVGQRFLLQEVIGMDQSVFLNSSNHERSELRKSLVSDPGDFLISFISYMKLRYENAKMYSLWPGNGFCDQN